MFRENFENTAAWNAFIILPLLPRLQLEKQPRRITHKLPAALKELQHQ